MLADLKLKSIQLLSNGLKKVRSGHPGFYFQLVLCICWFYIMDLANCALNILGEIHLY